MRSLLWVVLAAAPCLQEEAFEAAKVNKWIVSLSEDPTQEKEVGELHAYLKKHGKLGLVILKFEESFDRRPKDAKIRYLLGRLQVRDGNRTAALKCFQSAAQADPDYAFTYLAMAEIFEDQNDEKGLVGALEGVLQSSKDKAAVVGAVRKLAGHCAKRQEHQRVAGLWATVAERFADDAEILREAVKRIEESGKPALAADCLRSALAAKPLPAADRARFYLDLAMLERRAGRLSDATKSLQEAAKAAIDDPSLARKVDESILAYHREDDRLGDLVERYEKDLAINRTNPIYIWRLARVRMVQGQLPQAREILTAGIAKNPGNMLLLMALADVAELQGLWSEVRELALQFLGREPHVREHRRREGMACVEMGKYPEAEVCFRAYATTAAEAVEIARVYEKRQRFTDAATWYRTALDMKPDPEWSRALVGLLVRLDRIGDAEEEAARCTKGDREKWALMRDLLLQKGADVQACAFARKDAAANPKDFDAVFGLGKLLCTFAPSEAEATLRAALLLAKKEQRSRIYEELAWLAVGQKPAQVTLLRGEIQLLQKEEPNDGGYYYALYRLQPGSVEMLEEGRKADPRHVRLRQELAPYYLKQKQYDMAIDVYRELIEIDPGRRDHYVYAIGEVYWALGHKDAAFTWWAKVEGSAKDRVGLSFQLAKRLESENRFAQAIELLQQILKQEPEGAIYHWTLAQLYRQFGNFEGLMTEYKWILANSKDEGYLRTARQVVAEKLADHARAYAEEGSWSRALEEFTEALRYAPNEPATGSLLGHIARCCEHLRDYAKAAEYYHQLLSRFPGIVVAASQGRTMNAALFATLQLRGNPECLKAYEDIVGPLAKDLLQKSVDKGDRAGVERVITLYPLSRAAGDAAWWLAETWRKDGASIKAAAMLERLLTEFSLSSLDELVVRFRLVELSAFLKDWGTVSTQVGEMAARGKDKVIQIEGKNIAVKEYVQKWQKELSARGATGIASWGLTGRDSRNSSSTVQELVPPLVPKWRYAAVAQPAGNMLTLPPIYAAGGLVYVAKDDVLVALDGSSGSLRWSAPLRVQRTKARANNAIQGVSPSIEGRLAVSQGVIAGIDNDSEIRVYDAATGAPVWAKTTDVPVPGAGPAPAMKGRRVATVVQANTEHMELVCATRQCFIVREGDKLRAYSLRTGRIDWQSDVQAGPLPLAVDAGATNNFPIKLDRHVLESDGVLIHVYGDTIRAMDSLSGKDLWEVKQAGKAGNGGVSPWAAYFTVIPDGIARAVIAGDALVTLSAGEGKLTAYDLRTGRLRWDQPGDALVTESQLAADDQNLYSLVNKTLLVISHRTGERLWRREAKNYQPPMRQGTPPPMVLQSRMSIAGSRIFLTSSEELDGETSRLEAIDRKTAKTVWEHPWDALGKPVGGLRSIGVDLWGRQIPAQSSAPVICDGWLYVIRSDGFIYAFHGKSQELAALRDAVRRDPESAQARFQLGDLLGSEGQASLEIEEYRTALKLAQKKADVPAMKDLISELKSRLFVRYMKQGESTTDFEAALKAFAEARAFADGEASLGRVLVRVASVLLALKRELEAVDVLSSIQTLCPSALSPLEGAAETAGDYAKRQLAKLGPDAKTQWEKVHAEEMEKAFAPGKSVEELEKAIERYSFSSKADHARIRAARVHVDAKRYKEAILTLDKVRPDFLEKADAEIYFEAWDLLASALLHSGDDRRALGIYQKMLTDAAKDPARLGSIRERAEKRHKELKESWERNGVFGSPLQKTWESAAPAGKPAGPTLDAFRPAIDRGRAYALDLQGTLQAVDVTTLAVLWTASTEDFSSLFQTTNGLTVLPVDPLMAVKETVLVVGGKTLRAFDPVTGGPLWSMQSPDGDVVHQVVLDGNKVYTCETKGRVTARDERTGRLLWSVRPGASATGVMTDRSGMSGGGLFYTRIGAEGNRVVVQSAGDPGTLYAYDAATGKQAWKVVDATYQGYLKGRAELEVGQGMAVLGDSTGLLVCHDLLDGRVRWKLNVVAPVETILLTPDHVLIAMADQIVSLGAKSGRKEWGAAPEPNQWFSRDRDMRLGSTSLAAKGKWLVVGTPTALSILDLATGVIKDQTKSDVTAPPARQGKSFPFGKSFASVSLGPEGILWGIPSDAGTKWTLLR